MPGMTVGAQIQGRRGRSALLVVFLIAPVALGQAGAPDKPVGRRQQGLVSWAFPYRGGEPILLGSTTPADPAASVVVEFVDPPLLARPAASGSLRAQSLVGLERAQSHFEARVRAMLRPDEAASFRVRRRYTKVLNGVALSGPLRVLKELPRLAGVRRVHEDTRVFALIDHSVPEIGAPEVWSRFGTRGEGVTVAVIDSGVDYRQPALGGGLGDGFKVRGGHDFVNDDGDPLDDNGHGTHVAGIIAADAPGLTGVAPGTNLLAYKVLGPDGSGRQSDVIAAIETAVDPDGDGDTTDHVGVVSLSLGARGGPDDAVSIAADNAVAGGVLVCAAAGNDAHEAYGPSIGSPAAGRRVLAVGASEHDALAYFSSWGPTWVTAAIKPEVVAPGVGIRSTALGGGTATMSGTSMACPHVAGVGALLRAIHRDWDPARVVSAIVTTATDLGLDVMGQGGGKVDARGAAASSLFADPPTLMFGIDLSSAGAWSASRTLHVSNAAADFRRVSVAVSGVPSGASVSWAPETLDLEPGATADLTLTINVDAPSLPATPRSMAFGGSVRLAWESESIHVPWAFVRASRLHVLTEGVGLSVYSPGLALREPGFVGVDDDERRRYDVLLPEGSCYLQSFGGLNPSARWLVLREVEAQGESSVEIKASDAHNHITIAAGSVPDSGTHLTELQFQLPVGGLVDNVQMGVRSLPRLSDVPTNVPVRVFEWRNPGDEADRSFYRLEHPALAGLSGDVELGPVAGRRYPVELVLSRDGSDPTVSVGFGLCAPESLFWLNIALADFGFDLVPARGPFDLFLTDEEETAPFRPCTGLTATSLDPELHAVAGPIRAVRGRVASFFGTTAPPTAYWCEAGATLTIGGALQYPVLSRSPAPPGSDSFRLDVHGTLDEVRAEATTDMDSVLRRPDGSTIPGLILEPASGYGVIATLPSGLAEPVDLQLSSSHARGGSSDAHVSLTLHFDARQQPLHLPTLTSLVLLNASNRHLVAVPFTSAGPVLQFSAIGCSERDGCPGLDEASVSLRLRVHGSSEWRELPLSVGALDAGSVADLGHLAIGRVFTGRVPDDLLARAGWIDVRIGFENIVGNRSDWLLDPGFEVLPPRPLRHRIAAQ